MSLSHHFDGDVVWQPSLCAKCNNANLLQHLQIHSQPVTNPKQFEVIFVELCTYGTLSHMFPKVLKKKVKMCSRSDFRYLTSVHKWLLVKKKLCGESS